MINSKSASSFKQNNAPKKQGAFYEINLGKNNGPFLSKDIMYDNRKSMNLLMNQQTLKSHETMVDTIKKLQQSNKKPILAQQNVQNFTANIQYYMKQLQELRIVSSGMKVEEKQLHIELQQMGRRIQVGIGQLQDSSMSVLKQFFKKVNQMNNKDRQRNCQVRRQLEKMSQEDALSKKGLIECQNQIQSAQKFIKHLSGG